MPDIKIGFRLREIMRFMELSILFSRLKLLDKIKLKQITPLFVQAIQEYSERFSCGIEGIVSIYRLYATAEVSDEPLFDVLNCLARRDLEGSSSLLRSPVDGSELITIYWSLAKVKYLKLDFFRQTQRSLIKFLSNKDLKISEKEITKLFWALSSSNIYSKVVFDLLIQRYSLILDSFLAGEKTDISLYGLSTNSMALAQSRIKDDNFLEKVEKTVFKLAETIATKDVMLEYSFILLAMAKLSYKSQDICRLVLDSIRQNSKDLTSSMAINLLYAFILLDKLPKDISFILVNIINSSISIESNKEKRRLLRADELLTKYTEDICLDKALIENTKKEIASIYALPPMGSGFQDAVSDVFYDMELEYKQEVKVGPYFTDFVVTQGDLVGTVVEVDGVQYHGYRDSSQSTSEELLRAEIINKYGYNIVHIRSDKWQELDNESRIDWIEKLLSID